MLRKLILQVDNTYVLSRPEYLHYLQEHIMPALQKQIGYVLL